MDGRYGNHIYTSKSLRWEGCRRRSTKSLENMQRAQDSKASYNASDWERLEICYLTCIQSGWNHPPCLQEAQQYKSQWSLAKRHKMEFVKHLQKRHLEVFRETRNTKEAFGSLSGNKKFNNEQWREQMSFIKNKNGINTDRQFWGLVFIW